ncbi:tetratricopeptide repeat protein [Novosphingobium lentum]|uniref:tetratricopeptide repeat protein n=1 Tax=Novosphingobium lentum TaxID=145287 RepID=UPI000ACB64AD|nr:hypothetical protein [Novosphingobium lentum]
MTKVSRVPGARLHPGNSAIAIATAAFLSISAPAFASIASNPAPVDSQAVFSKAHGALGSGATFTPETCAAAVPDLERVIALTISSSGETGPKAYAHLERGYCYIATDEPAKAVPMFKSVIEIAALQPASMAMLAGEARACLAHFSAIGQGLERDPERALGYYASSAGYRCRAADYDPADEAARLVLASNPYTAANLDSLVYHFLRQGSARDHLTAIRLYSEKASGSGVPPQLISLAMAGIYAGGDRPADVEALAELNRQLGEWHLARGNRAQAYGYFLAARSRTAREALLGAERTAPFTLELPDGHPWAPADAN